MFPDDTKLYIDAGNPESVRTLHRDFALVGEWYIVWQKTFNLEKCHALHVGTASQAENNSLLDSAISSIDEERDQRIVITEELMISAQCIVAEQKAQKILGYIKRVYRYTRCSRKRKLNFKV